MDRRHLHYAAQPAPRYTSYPAATHFQPLPAETHAAWLGALDSSAAVSLYLHIPYCREICLYCACHTFAARRQEVIDGYVDALIAEIDLVGGLSAARRVREIHWGGGTPNILSPADFDRIMDAVRARFDLSGLHEHAVEIDPRLLTTEQAEAFARGGVNRASFGVQDFNPHVQDAIGRVQPFEVVADSALKLETAGVRNLNFDLMYGLPQQTIADCEESVRLALSLAPDRLAIFGYAHVPWFKSRQKLIDAASLPDSETRLLQAEAMRAALLAAGYKAIGFDHFARPDDPLARAAESGDLKRNFQGYVDDPCTVLLGMGASAISTLPQGYAQNNPEPGAWTRAVLGGGLATLRGRALTDDDVMRRAMIEDVLCRFSLDLSRYGGAARFAPELSALAPLAADGLVAIEGDQLTIPLEARPLARLVAKAFDAYEVAAGKHSASV